MTAAGTVTLDHHSCSMASMRRRVARALDAGRLQLAIQPIVSAESPHKRAFSEGLVRMIDASGGVIPAGRFIDAVAGTPLAPRLDRQVLDLGLSLLQRTPDLRLSLNAAAESLECPHWTATLGTWLDSDATLAERLILELTEQTAPRDIDRLGEVMQHLQTRGVAFALDDFGSGFTTFRSLKDLRFDILKIDGSFCTAIDSDPDNRAFVTALVGLARHFGTMVVGERVETLNEADTLLNLGVDALQGYAFARPTLVTQPAPEAQIA